MPALRVPIMSGERAGRCGPAAEKLAQPVAATAALLVLVWALAAGYGPAAPLWTIAGLLAVGLLAGPLSQLAGDRAGHAYAQAATAFAALLVLSFELPAAHPQWPVSPLWVVALLLGLGLAARPLMRIAGGQRVPGSAPAIAALLAMLVLIWTLSVDGIWWYTASPGTLHSVDRLPIGALRIVIVLLGLALVAAARDGRERVDRILAPVATGVALLVLLLALVSAPAAGISPVWPFWWAAATLGLGLGVDLLERPGATVLAERIDELSRTRSGVLDVQATELRRIERDLHDGAQVRLVALSMKLGRAEDRYRGDPATAALLREAREDATAAIRELRELARGIAPPVLVNRGLDAAVRSLAQRSGIEAVVSSRLERRPPPAVERAGYFVVAESLTNAAKHAPGARVEISLHASGRDLLVEITDFGPGGANPAGGGLTGLRQRVEALDGVLRVTSPAGVGTQVEAVMPCGR